MGMVFSFSIGSEGIGEESYSIIFPLVLSPGYELNIESTIPFKMSDGLHYSLEKHHHLYSLKIGRFPTRDAAQNYLDKLHASLKWVSLKNKLGIRSPSERLEPRMSDEPITVSEGSNVYDIVRNEGWSVIDGSYDFDKDKLTIIPEHKKLMRIELGHFSVTLGLTQANIFNAINESISFRGLNEILLDKKLCLAIDMYSSCQFEVSTTSKFIKLVTVLESLLPDLDIPDEALLLLEKAKTALKDEKKAAESRKESTQLIDHLMSRLGKLKKQSIGATMESFISNCLDDFPDLGEKKVILKKLKNLYAIRSSLLHDGKFDDSSLQDGNAILSTLVPNLLTKLYIKCSS